MTDIWENSACEHDYHMLIFDRCCELGSLMSSGSVTSRVVRYLAHGAIDPYLSVLADRGTWFGVIPRDIVNVTLLYLPDAGRFAGYYHNFVDDSPKYGRRVNNGVFRGNYYGHHREDGFIRHFRGHAGDEAIFLESGHAHGVFDVGRAGVMERLHWLHGFRYAVETLSTGEIEFWNIFDRATSITCAGPFTDEIHRLAFRNPAKNVDAPRATLRGSR